MGGEIRFTIPGYPMGKQRPRFVRRGKFVSTYTPKETKNYEAKVKKSYLKISNGFSFNNDPVDISTKAYYPIPKSISKKKRQQMIDGTIPCTKKPDIENNSKAIMDGLNNVAYNDDSQVCKLFAEKMYGEEPRVEVTLKKYEPPKKNIISPFIFIQEERTIIKPFIFLTTNEVTLTV